MRAMRDFLFVLAIFLVSHVVGAVPQIRRALVARFGEAKFLAGYILMSASLFTWLLIAMRGAPPIYVWPPTVGAYAFAVVLMPLALMLFGAGVLQANPLSIAFVPGSLSPGRPGAVAITRHPLLWGLSLWGLAHVPPNGEVVPLILFGSLGVFGLLGMYVVERKKRRVLGEAAWQALAANTSVVPFAAILRGRMAFPTDAKTLLGLVAGALFSAWLLHSGHLMLFERDPLGMFAF